MALPGCRVSRAWENMCSEPLVGRELPAMHMETPEAMIGLRTSHMLSSSPGLMRFAFETMLWAANMERLYAEVLNSSSRIRRAKSQSLSAVRLEITSAQPDAR